MWLKLLLITLVGCNSIQSTSYDLRGVVSGNRMGAVPLGRSLGEGDLDIEGVCSETGMACQNCTHAVTCIPLPVGWLKVPLQQCPEGQTCNAHLGQCSNEPVPECEVATNKFQHICEQIGIFPDAYDCRKFHLCSPPDGLPNGRPADHRAALCPRQYGYDPRIAQCSIILKNGQCDKKPVPECKKVGQSDALESSPNHYYVCLSRHGNLYPQIFICPHGWYFWDNYCQPELKKPVEGIMNNINENNKDSQAHDTLAPTEKVSYKVDSFFSTEKTATNPVDTFLADKFDLTNYETTDDDAQNTNNEFANSFETDFW
ncbi:unnamed protein product [Euphydryas editha]|uniref:Chitin-binding type-2 domain-containing protein n=1 Tax=Euphydryas editha TaxID=104508 RepID=A0AAU9V5Z5_EUPED|nr:unnamed protein product [Euphydryas editha]